MEPMKSKAPQLHLEYRFYKLLGSHGMLKCLSTILKLPVTPTLTAIKQLTQQTKKRETKTNQ